MEVSKLAIKIIGAIIALLKIMFISLTLYLLNDCNLVLKENEKEHFC